MLFFAYGDANFELQFCAFIQNPNLLAYRKHKNAFLLDTHPQEKHFLTTLLTIYKVVAHGNSGERALKDKLFRNTSRYM